MWEKGKAVTSRRFRRLDPFGSVTAKLGVGIVMDNNKSGWLGLSRGFRFDRLWPMKIQLLKGETLKHAIRRNVENDPLRIQDLRVMRDKFGVDCRPPKRKRRLG